MEELNFFNPSTGLTTIEDVAHLKIEVDEFTVNNKFTLSGVVQNPNLEAVVFSNQSDINQNTQDIQINLNNISTNASNISNNSSSINNLQNDKVEKSGDTMTGDLIFNVLSGPRYIGFSNGGNALKFDLSQGQFLNSTSNFFFNIDTNNTDSVPNATDTRFFRWATNSQTASGGVELMRLEENGDLSILGTINNVNLTTLNSNVSTNTNNISGLDSRLTTAENNITSNDNDISGLDNRLTTAENNITSNDNDISALDNRLTTAEGNITSNDNDISGLDNRLTSAENNIISNDNDISGLDNRLTSAENNIISNDNDISGILTKTNKISLPDSETIRFNSGQSSGSAIEILDQSIIGGASELKARIKIQTINNDGIYYKHYLQNPSSSENIIYSLDNGSPNPYDNQINIYGVIGNEQIFRLYRGVQIDNFTPNSTTLKLYSNNNELHFNGNKILTDTFTDYIPLNFLNDITVNLNGNNILFKNNLSPWSVDGVPTINGVQILNEGSIKLPNLQTQPSTGAPYEKIYIYNTNLYYDSLRLLTTNDLTSINFSINSNTSDISDLQNDVNSNDSDISNLQNDKYDKTGGLISGDVNINQKLIFEGNETQKIALVKSNEWVTGKNVYVSAIDGNLAKSLRFSFNNHTILNDNLQIRFFINNVQKFNVENNEIRLSADVFCDNDLNIDRTIIPSGNTIEFDTGNCKTFIREHRAKNSAIAQHSNTSGNIVIDCGDENDPNFNIYDNGLAFYGYSSSSFLGYTGAFIITMNLNDLYFYARNDGSSSYSANGFVNYGVNSQMNFTGQHRNVINDEELKEGMILCSTGQYKNYGVKEEELKKPTINEALPILECSTRKKQKNVFGVYSGNKDINHHNVGSFTSILNPTDKNEKYHYVNGSGEGSILVCGENGSLENGDFICTSNKKGVGMKQDETYFSVFTIAKVTQDVIFSFEDEVKLVGCLYML